MKKKILFSHQSTLAHYRIDLYNQIQKHKPDWLDFEVLIDDSNKARKFFFKDTPNLDKVEFNLKSTNTYLISRKNKIFFQSFLKDLGNYDLLIFQHALHNLSYPLSYFLSGNTKIAYWGHGRDILKGESSLPKKAMEAFKFYLARQADGYFAYTEGVKRFLKSKGVDEKQIYTVNNTIDIEKNRATFKRLSPQYKRQPHNFVYVGRLQDRKRIAFLLEVFEKISKDNPSSRLHLVGGGDERYVNLINYKKESLNINYYGVVTDIEKLGTIFCKCQYLLFPGDVGLGPLQALCFDVIPIVIDGDTHGPEFEYLNDKNSHILESSTTKYEMAEHILTIIGQNNYQDKIATSWQSVNNYTMENMAKNFIVGIRNILGM